MNKNDLKTIVKKDNQNKNNIEKINKDISLLSNNIDEIKEEIKSVKKYSVSYIEQMDRKYRNIMQTTSIYSFLIVLSLTILIPIINSSSPFAFLFKINIFIAWGWIFFSTIGICFLAYFLLKNLLKLITEYWKND